MRSPQGLASKCRSSQRDKQIADIQALLTSNAPYLGALLKVGQRVRIRGWLFRIEGVSQVYAHHAAGNCDRHRLLC
jgi:hypothetical protein